MNWLTIKSGIVIKKKYLNVRYKSTKITEFLFFFLPSTLLVAGRLLHVPECDNVLSSRSVHENCVDRLCKIDS
jgi:hypothetical protein